MDCSRFAPRRVQSRRLDWQCSPWQCRGNVALLHCITHIRETFVTASLSALVRLAVWALQ